MPSPETETAAPASQEVSEAAHGWLYDAITAKMGTTEGVMGANGPAGGSRIALVLPIDGKAYLVRLECVDE